MADHEAYPSRNLDSLGSPDNEAARVQDFADAVRHALYAHKKASQVSKPDVLGELEAALSALDVWIENDQSGSEIVELFSKLQTKNLKHTKVTPEPGEDC